MVPTRNVERQAPPPPSELDRHSSPDEHWIGEHPLADEHAVLLHEVHARGGAVRAALSEGGWPDREVAALVDYLRYEVLDQAVTTERLLFPLAREGLADSDRRQLADDHVQLRDLTDQLANAAIANGDRSERDDLAKLLGALEEFLVRHMRAEEALLSATTSAGVESLRQPFRCHLWFPLTEGPEVDLDALPRAFAHRAVLERFSRLRLGERLLVRSSRELDGLWSLLSCGRPGEYAWNYLEEGPNRWRAEVARRAPE
jgi:uncharacterized protein (DUF2249 family)/hemerythrin-like domain-containing protein